MAKATKTGNATKNSGAGANDSMLQEFFVEELKDIYYAEKLIAKTLPKMKRAATTEKLKTAFEKHLEQTKKQIERLDKVFAKMGEKPKGKKCEAMEGIVKEGEGVIEDTEQGTATRDVALILAAQKVEHYEISTYGGLAQLARTLGKDDVARLLEQTLEEEKKTDLLLTDIAERSVNYQSAQEEA
ncbi:MAG: hypothetical protein JWP69_518 [Flaviaesturariibacter sp.]|nr:hypothetical protein [Flaviaesturariibacter sp.]